MNPLLQFIKDNSNNNHGVSYKAIYCSFRLHKAFKGYSSDEYKIRLNKALKKHVNNNEIETYENVNGLKYKFKTDK